jgi:hypothetical protein
MVVVHLVEQKGVGARAEKIDALSLSRFLSWETEGVELICLCYMAHATPAPIRYAIRRIRRLLPEVSIIANVLKMTRWPQPPKLYNNRFARPSRR